MFYGAAWLNCYGRLCVPARYYRVSAAVTLLVLEVLEAMVAVELVKLLKLVLCMVALHVAPALPTAFTSSTHDE